MGTETKEKLALIDVGSNTIRTVVYGRYGGRVRKLYSERDYTGLLAYVRDGRLNTEGITRLCETLAHMRRFCALCQCASVTAFSTASLRGVTNRAAVLSAVRRRTGLEIRPLSEEEEMACDCEGLRRSGVREGVAFDLGGGSCQVFRFGEEGLQEGASLPFGCLSLGTHFVREGLFPSREEAKTIRRFVRNALEDRLPGLSGIAPPTLYAMGGTARAAAKVLRALSGDDTGAGVSCEALHRLLRDARRNEARTVDLLRRVIPGRMSTLLPGIAAMEAIARHVGRDTIDVSPVGVREGFLWTYLLPSVAP